MDNLERFEVKLRTDVYLENEVYQLCEKLPARSRSSVYKRQILAALADAELMVESGKAADLQTALYHLAKRAGLSEVEISIYMPEFNFSSMQPIDTKGFNSDGNATQKFSNFEGESRPDFKSINHLQPSDPPVLSVGETPVGVCPTLVDEPENNLDKGHENKISHQSRIESIKDGVDENKDGSVNDENNNNTVAVDAMKLLGW